jgi:hypothetical protein
MNPPKIVMYTCTRNRPLPAMQKNADNQVSDYDPSVPRRYACSCASAANLFIFLLDALTTTNDIESEIRRIEVVTYFESCILAIFWSDWGKPSDRIFCLHADFQARGTFSKSIHRDKVCHWTDNVIWNVKHEQRHITIRHFLTTWVCTPTLLAVGWGGSCLSHTTQPTDVNVQRVLCLHASNSNVLRNRYFWFKKSYPCNRAWRSIGLWDVEALTFSRQSAHRWWWSCQPYAPAVL